MHAVILTPRDWLPNLIKRLNEEDDDCEGILDGSDPDVIEILSDATGSFLYWGYKVGGDPTRMLAFTSEIVQGHALYEINHQVLYHRWVELLRFHWVSLEMIGHPDTIQYISPTIQPINGLWTLTGWYVCRKGDVR